MSSAIHELRRSASECASRNNWNVQRRYLLFRPTKQGACKGHKGVKEWYGALPPAPAAAAGQSTPTATPAPTSPKPTATPPTAKATTAGGGPGQVWVNMATKVYHCPGNKWYGKTKQGEFMSEADAKAKGFKADHGKACS